MFLSKNNKPSCFSNHFAEEPLRNFLFKPREELCNRNAVIRHPAPVKAGDLRPPLFPGCPVHSNISIIVWYSQVCRISNTLESQPPSTGCLRDSGYLRTASRDDDQIGRPHAFDGGLHVAFGVLQSVVENHRNLRRHKTRRKINP